MRPSKLKTMADIALIKCARKFTPTMTGEMIKPRIDSAHLMFSEAQAMTIKHAVGFYMGVLRDDKDTPKGLILEVENLQVKFFYGQPVDSYPLNTDEFHIIETALRLYPECVDDVLKQLRRFFSEGKVS